MRVVQKGESDPSSLGCELIARGLGRKGSIGSNGRREFGRWVALHLAVRPRLVVVTTPFRDLRLGLLEADARKATLTPVSLRCRPERQL